MERLPAAGQILAFPGRPPNQVGFERAELARILDLYGRMVAAGEWRDYALPGGLSYAFNYSNGRNAVCHTASSFFPNCM